MNPFDLRGPEFLWFYAVLAAGALTIAAFLRRSREAGAPPKIDLDPYTIAYLRGAENEVLRVAMFSLIDRGLLRVESDKVVTAENVRPESVRHEIEHSILRWCAKKTKPEDLFKNSSLQSACAPYKSTLASHALLPDEAINATRTNIFRAVLVVVGGTSVIKLVVAFSRGRMNVGFLIFFTLVAIAVAASICFPRLTARGKAMLEDLRSLYSGLRRRASTIPSGGASIDALMLAAVFGLAALPAGSFSNVRKLFKRSTTTESSSSSCGSSCGSSGGSSCGGGGGGCGGCGS